MQYWLTLSVIPTSIYSSALMDYSGSCSNCYKYMCAMFLNFFAFVLSGRVVSTAISVGAKFECLFAYVIILPREKFLGGDCCVRDVIRRACAPGLVAGFACLLCWTRSENVSSLFLVFLFLDYYNNCTNLSNAVCGPLGPDITYILRQHLAIMPFLPM